MISLQKPPKNTFKSTLEGGNLSIITNHRDIAKNKKQ